MRKFSNAATAATVATSAAQYVWAVVTVSVDYYTTVKSVGVFPTEEMALEAATAIPDGKILKMPVLNRAPQPLWMLVATIGGYVNAEPVLEVEARIPFCTIPRKEVEPEAMQAEQWRLCGRLEDIVADVKLKGGDQATLDRAVREVFTTGEWKEAPDIGHVLPTRRCPAEEWEAKSSHKERDRSRKRAAAATRKEREAKADRNERRCRERARDLTREW